MASNNRRSNIEDSMTVKEFLAICLTHWHWFAICLAICLGVGTYIIISTPEVYKRSVSVMVREGGKTAASSSNQQLAELGLDVTPTTIMDELMTFTSESAMSDVVRRLGIDTEYKRPGMFRDYVMYGASAPVDVTFLDIEENQSARLVLEVARDSLVTLSELSLNGRKLQETYSGRLEQEIETEMGRIVASPNIYYKPGYSATINVSKVSVPEAVKRFKAATFAKLREKSNIIDITCDDQSIDRGNDILSTVISVYNENWVKQRNQRSVSTNEFIKERLAIIESELSAVEGNITQFKSSHAIIDVGTAANQALGQATAFDTRLQELSAQLNMAKYVREFVTSPEHVNDLIPTNTGVPNSSIEAQIAEFNKMQLQRSNIISYSSSQNPLVLKLNKNMGILREAITSLLDADIILIEERLAEARSAQMGAMAKVIDNPSQAQKLLSIERQQKVKETLYLFLLQKREENELSQVFTAYNTTIIAPVGGSYSPVEPRKQNILAIALFLGLLLPALALFTIEALNTTIRGRKDVDNLDVPFLGEVPQWDKKKTGGYRILVKHMDRTTINEAFRMLRTNLNFITASSEQKKDSQVVMITSYNPGSGKTFITSNLAAAFSIGGKKVLAIDLDLRRRSLSKYIGIPSEGVSDYLAGRVDDLSTLIRHDEESGLDFLPVGKIPPNPSELLLTSRMTELIEKCRSEYDLVFLDCPPVDIVADASIIGGHSDITIFVLRSKLMQKSMLPDLERLYDEKKFNRMSIVLNGTEMKSGYGYNRYGYAYGHGSKSYGYGYGYGYGNSRNDK